MPKQCKVEGCTNVPFNNKHGYCQFHMYKAYIPTKSKSTRKTIRKKRKSLKTSYFGFKTQIEMFMYVWETQPHICWLTDHPLRYKPGDDKWVNQMAHVLRKGQYTYFKLNPDNMRLLDPDIHDLVDNFKEEYWLKYPHINFNKWFKLQEEMKEEYKMFKNKNLLA